MAALTRAQRVALEVLGGTDDAKVHGTGSYPKGALRSEAQVDWRPAENLERLGLAELFADPARLPMVWTRARITDAGRAFLEGTK